MVKAVLIIVVILLSNVTVHSQDDTLYITKAQRNLFEVKKIRLNDVVTKRRFIPSKIRKYRNVETLSLRPAPVSFGRPSGGGPCIIRYAGSKIRALPSWISELQNLKEIDLIGINKISYDTELQKLYSLKKLTKLSIDPDQFNDDMIDILSKFSQLESLKIRASLTEEQFSTLQARLPDCKIVTGIYADY
jgi:hypothetical protein